jgi:hypothetical protein
MDLQFDSIWRNGLCLHSSVFYCVVHMEGGLDLSAKKHYRL